ncbi:MAG: hypothetical protein O3A00_29065, partial [Planctomycetota bacterium]|nr:hypothetical protein [Planctomycetota bacterium]
VFVFYSAIAPFIAFSSLLQGFDFAPILFLLCAGVLWSIFICMFSLMVSTLAKSRILQGIIGIVLFLVLVWQAIGSMIFTGFILADFMPIGSTEFWWGIGCVVAAGVSYILLFQQVAVARLTFESDNRSTGIRIVCSVQFWMIWIALSLFGWEFGWTVIEYEAVIALACVSAAHWMVVGLLASTEQDYLSRRIRRNMPRLGLLRMFVAPWLPGGGRGFVYLLMHLLALNLIVLLGDWPEVANNITIGISC